MAFSVETKLGELLDNPTTREILVKFMPQIETAGPMINLGRGLSIKTLATFPQAKLSPEALLELDAELTKL